MSADIRFLDYKRLAPGTGLCPGGYHVVLYSQNDNRTPCLFHPSSEPIHVNAYTVALLSSRSSCRCGVFMKFAPPTSITNILFHPRNIQLDSRAQVQPKEYSNLSPFPPSFASPCPILIGTNFQFLLPSLSINSPIYLVTPFLRILTWSSLADSAHVLGVEEAVCRLKLAADAGADVRFIEGV
jgi:hypothetical protein